VVTALRVGAATADDGRGDVSLAELETGSGGAREDFGRTPPQDVAAEQSVLGGMLLSKDAIADVIEVLRGNDFYVPRHETVYEAVLDLYGRGEPADAVTVAAELTKRGELASVGGPAYLHTLLSSVPTAANAGYYARIVRERAVLRRLVTAGTRIVQLGYATDGGDVDEIVNAAQAEVYSVTERRTSEDYQPLSAIIEGAIDEIEASSHRGDGLTGIPTGFADLDRLTNGFHGGQMIVIAARPAVGKALALDTPLPTPHGWTSMGEVRVGELVLGADGCPTRVVAATDVLLGRPCYEVHFSDGSVVVADGQHQWLTETRASRRSGQQARTGYDRCRNRGTLAEVRTTAQISATLRCSTPDDRLNHSVDLASPLELPDRDLLIEPYTLGAWLGDGTSAAAQITTDDPEILTRIQADGYVTRSSAPRRYAILLPEHDRAPEKVCVVCGQALISRTAQVRTCGRGCGGRERGVAVPAGPSACPDCGKPTSGLRRCQSCRDAFGTVTGRLWTLGVLGHKHIPVEFLRASERQRRDLLAGLLDTDGTVALCGTVQVTVGSEHLALDIRELVTSLGYRSGLSTKPVPGRRPETSTAYTLTMSTDDDVFALERKLLLHKERRRRTFQRRNSRFITDVRPVPSVPVRCIQVDNEDHLYLAGRAMIPTHNSTLGLDVARSAAIHHKLASVIFSLEMGRNEITMRLLSAEARIPLQNMRKGTMREEDWTRLARTMGDVSDAPLFIDDSPNMSLMEIRAKCRRLKQRHGLKLVIVDYLQLMSSGKRVESRQQEVSEFSRALKLLAKELEVPVIALSQLNRGPEQRTDKKPQMSDLRESGCLTADTRILRADTGAETTLGELHASRARDVPVWSLDQSLRYVRRHLTHVFPTGRRQVYRLTLASGKLLRLTANHPLLTYEGWAPAGSLECGARVAVPRHVPAPERVATWDDAQVILLAGLLGDEPFVPEPVFHLPKRQIALFLRHLWATDGSVTLAEDGRGGRVSYASTSHQLIEDVSRLLLRFGISCRVRRVWWVRAEGRRDGWTLDICGAEDQKRFLGEIGVHGLRGEAAERLLGVVAAKVSNPDPDTVPRQVWDRVRNVLADHAVGDREFAGPRTTQFCGSTSWKHAPRRERLGRVAQLLGDAELEILAVNDVFWDEVVAVEPDGEEEVFDATVLGNHNFVANGVAVHNSIEQDADMVILLHREDMYEKESPRAGEADFIVAKHRNGPTDTITVAFQGHYSRFVDMAT
jgi:replicative DNA helicase